MFYHDAGDISTSADKLQELGYMTDLFRVPSKMRFMQSIWKYSSRRMAT